MEVRQFNCPNCGASLSLLGLGRSKSIVCSYCNSQIDLTQPPYSVLGSVGARPDPVMTPFQVGMEGAVADEMHRIIGRIRYRDEEDAWDEWLLLSAKGAYRWFSDSTDVGLVLWHPFAPSKPVDPRTIRRGATLDLGEEQARVRSQGTASIDYLEGELTWRARVGDTMSYAEATSDRALYSVEWTDEEIEFFRGEHQDRPAIENSFGVKYERPADRERVAAAGAGAGGYNGCLTPSGLVIVLVIVLVLGCLVMSAMSSPGVGGFFFPVGGVSSGSPGRGVGGGGSGGGGK